MAVAVAAAAASLLTLTHKQNHFVNYVVAESEREERTQPILQH